MSESPHSVPAPTRKYYQDSHMEFSYTDSEPLPDRILTCQYDMEVHVERYYDVRFLQPPIIKKFLRHNPPAEPLDDVEYYKYLEVLTPLNPKQLLGLVNPSYCVKSSESTEPQLYYKLPLLDRAKLRRSVGQAKGDVYTHTELKNLLYHFDLVYRDFTKQVMSDRLLRILDQSPELELDA